jgi:hypothetical protein
MERSEVKEVSRDTEKAILEQRVQLLQRELKEIQDSRNKELMKRIQAQANGEKVANTALFFAQLEECEDKNTRLQRELDAINMKHEIEIEKLKLENKKIEIEKESEMERLKCRMERELKNIKDAYRQEKKLMKEQLEQANIQAKAFQMLSANETYLSPVNIFTHSLEKRNYRYPVPLRIDGKTA